MRRFLFLAVALLALTAFKEGVPAASHETSPGGIGYTLLHLPETDDITVQIAWATDWAYRAETNKAAPSVGVDLILEGGAEGYPAGDAGERFADLGSYADLLSSADDIIGELKFERRNMDETIAVVNAHLRAPSLNQMWFDRIRDEVAQNNAEAQAQPRRASFDALLWAIFGNQPLRNALSLDDPDTFTALRREDVVAWYRETLTRAPEAIVVAGNIGAEEAGAAVDALLAGLPEADHTISRATVPDFSPRRILLHTPESKVTSLALVAPLPPTRLGSEFEDAILIDALGGDQLNGPLSTVRAKLRASYGFVAGIDNYTREDRFLYLSGQVETAKLAVVERAVREAYARFLESGPSGALADRKAPLEAVFSKLPESVVRQARSELQSLLDGFDAGRTLNLVEELNAVTDDSLQARLNGAFPHPDSFIVIAASPDADALPDACVIRTPSEAADCP